MNKNCILNSSCQKLLKAVHIILAASDINLNKIRHMPIENVNLSKINDGI